MKNRIWLALLVLLVTAPVQAAWNAKTYEIYKRESGLQNMFVRYELEKAGFPPGATIPKNKSLIIPYPKERTFELSKNAKNANAVNLAMMAAITAAGWSIDELTKQVTEPNWVDPEGYQSGYYWGTGGNYTLASTPRESCQMRADYNGANINIFQVKSTSGGVPISYYCALTNNPNGVSYTTGRSGCPGGSTDTWCQTPEQEEGEPTLVPDPVVVDQVMPYLDNLPDYQLDDIFKDERGVPMITPELKDAIDDYNQDLADADPNLTWDPNTGTFTYTNPADGTTTDFEGTPDANETADNSASDQSPNGSEWPDFCDWTTAAGFCNETAPEQPSYQDVIDGYGSVETSIQSQESPLPVLPDFVPGFGGASMCQGIQFDADVGPFSMHQNFDKHCEIAATIINPILEWLFAILAAFYCWTVYREETTRGF